MARDHRVPENRPWLRAPDGFGLGQEPGAEDANCLPVIADNPQDPGDSKPTLICGGAPDANFKVAKRWRAQMGKREVRDIIRMLRYRR